MQASQKTDPIGKRRGGGHRLADFPGRKPLACATIGERGPPAVHSRRERIEISNAFFKAGQFAS